MMSTDTSRTAEFAESSDCFQPYDQFILFGDSITQGSHDQVQGFACAPALQNGSFSSLRDSLVFLLEYSLLLF